MAETCNFGYWGITSEEILKSQFPLHRACRDGEDETLASLLVDAQHGIYEEDSFYGWSPAHWAAYFGKLSCVRKLMQQTRVGVDCNVRTSRFGQTPTHLAAFGGHPNCLQWLLQSNALIDGQDYLGETPTHKAARTGSIECATLLASHGAKLFICNKSGQTAAQLAATCGYDDCARYLEEACRRQQNLPRGVYANGVDHTSVQPSPLDVTVQMNGTNGMMEPANDCEMDEDSMGGGGDVTTDRGVCVNHVAVGGRKRSRENVEEENHKRQRTQMNGLASQTISYCSHHALTSPSLIHQPVSNSYGPVSSSDEHRASMMVEQGYDSLFYTSMHA